MPGGDSGSGGGAAAAAVAAAAALVAASVAQAVTAWRELRRSRRENAARLVQTQELSSRLASVGRRGPWQSAAGDVAVSTFTAGAGTSLYGRKKWLGGSVGADGTLYAVPSHAGNVVALQPASERVSLLPLPSTGKALTDVKAHNGPWAGKFKWLRAVRANDGCIYGLPAFARRVLRIDTSKGTGEGAVTVLDTELPQGQWKWHGGSLGLDGNIYAIPANAERVLRVKPATGEVRTIGDKPLLGKNKYYGGIPGPKMPDGSMAIYGMPYNARNVLKIVPETGEVIELGNLPEGKAKWHGGVRSGNFIISFPAFAETVLKVNCITDEVTQIGGPLPGRYKWLGGCVGPDGCVYGVPADSTVVLKVDPVTDKVTTFGHLPSDENKWQGGVLAPDGCIYCIPANAPWVLRIEPLAERCELIGAMGIAEDKFQGGFLTKDEATGSWAIYGLPENADALLKIAPITKR